jgi:branched-chain amino acid transport system permease protein
MVEANRSAGRPTLRQRLVSYVPYIIIVIILLVLFPLVPAYAKSMLTQILIFGLFAMSLNLLVGYLGLFSLGHAAFFGVGGYTSAILVTKFGITSFWLAAPAGILLTVVVAAILGVIALRVTGMYFLFVTMAFGELLSAVALKWTSMTGGADGTVGIGYPNLGLPFSIHETSFYYLVLIIVVISAFLMYRLVNSPFGRALQGIREDERLMQHLGYNTWLFKYITYIIAALFAGVAGILFAHFNNIFVSSYLDVTMSTTVALMIIIGSSSMIFGPITGSAVILFLQYYISIFTPARWPLVLGAVFVIAIMFLRKGISFYIIYLWKRMVGHGGA